MTSLARITVSEALSPRSPRQKLMADPLPTPNPTPSVGESVEGPAAAQILVRRGWGTEPGLARKVWNVATALAAFVADSGRTVTAEQYRARLEICDGCDRRRDNKCLECGCSLALKARGRAMKCPLAKWPEIPK
jgi:hypothetical protein